MSAAIGGGCGAGLPSVAIKRAAKLEALPVATFIRRAAVQARAAVPCLSRGPEAAAAASAQIVSISRSPWVSWWALQDSNLRPLPCEGSALPLS